MEKTPAGRDASAREPVLLDQRAGPRLGDSPTSTVEIRSKGTMRDYILEKLFDEPVSLRQALEVRERCVLELPMPTHTICNTSVMHWEHWLDALTHWRAPLLQREFFAKYAPLTETVVIPNFRASIREVEGLSSMSEQETYYPDLDALAMNDAAVTAGGLEMLHELLAWRRSDRQTAPAIDEGEFYRHLWDGRIFWWNSGGAEEFAGARYLARKHGVEVDLRPRPLTCVRMHDRNMHALLADWAIFVVRRIHYGRDLTSPAGNFFQLLFTTATAADLKEEAMRAPSISCCLDAYELKWIDVDLPGFLEPPWSLPDHEMRIVLVEKRAGLATRAIGALRAAGAYDLGAHLLALCTGQRSRLSNGTKADVVSATSGVLTRPYDDISLQ